MKQHDVVVVGGGHNGLVAACYLAKAGFDTCVVEALDEIGGDIVTNELTLPGFKHDRGATMHGMIQANPMLINDELGLKSKYGLEYIYSEINFATTFKDGDYILQCTDIDRTCESIAKISPEDAVEYRKWVQELMPASNFINTGSFSAPPSFGAMVAQFDTNPIGHDLIRAMHMSAWEVVTERFKHPKVITHLTKMICEMFINPEEKGTAFYLYMLVPGSHAAPYAMPKGGSGELCKALGRCLEDMGGTIYLNSEVKRIAVEGGRATKVVLASGEEIVAKKEIISSLDPRLLFGEGKIVDQGAVSERICQEVQSLRNPSLVGTMIHVALDAKPEWKGGTELDKSLMVEPCPDFEDYRGGFDAIRYGRLPKEVAPMVCCQSLIDPSRAPEGKHVLYVGPLCPWELAEGGWQAWEEMGEKYADQAMEQLGEYIVNLKDIVLARHVDSPLDAMRWNANNVNGTVLGPASYVHQMFANRPCPEMGHYKTPVEGLWLCGVGTHPAGGVTGGSRAMVPLVLEELGVDIEDIID